MDPSPPPLNATSECKYPAAADFKGTHFTEQRCFCSRVVILFTFSSVWEEMEGKLTTCDRVNGRNKTHLSPLACTRTELKEPMRELCFKTRILFRARSAALTITAIRIMNDGAEYSCKMKVFVFLCFPLLDSQRAAGWDSG